MYSACAMVRDPSWPHGLSRRFFSTEFRQWRALMRSNHDPHLQTHHLTPSSPENLCPVALMPMLSHFSTVSPASRSSDTGFACRQAYSDDMWCKDRTGSPAIHAYCCSLQAIMRPAPQVFHCILSCYKVVVVSVGQFAYCRSLNALDSLDFMHILC